MAPTINGDTEDAEGAEFQNEFSFENVSRRFATCTVPILDVIPTPRRQHVNVYVCAMRRDEEHVSSHSERMYLNVKFLEARGSTSRHVGLSEDVSRSSDVWCGRQVRVRASGRSSDCWKGRAQVDRNLCTARDSTSRHVGLSEDVSRSSGRLVWTSGTCPRVRTFSRLLERSCASRQKSLHCA